MYTGLFLILAALSACSLAPAHGHQHLVSFQDSTHSPEVIARSDGNHLDSLSETEPSSDGHQAVNTQSSFSSDGYRRFSRSTRSVRRNSPVSNRANAMNHRIRDRDYVGWMDFGRRSAEEYEYSS
ncbi:hypothetical protein DNTS_005543 [Danionella cerebrum]|uniref:Gastrin/cholecystokinin peptide hormone domain-containing protein n=1 Tax=Danionella cerebrum TaxID=2873325 RepID=A0A553NJV9_9TELE|nr:hypothetical protein DNTS_005543 [Danionella translucida]